MATPKQTISWDITWSSIGKIVTTVVIITLFFLLQNVLISLFIAVILMSAISPLVRICKTRFNISSRAAIVMVFLLTFTVVGLLIFIVVPPLIKQLGVFLANLPEYVRSAVLFLGFADAEVEIDAYNNSLLSFLNQQSGQLAGNAFNFTITILSSILESISIAVFTFYLLLEKEEFEGSIVRFIPFVGQEKKKEYLQLLSAVEQKLGYWARGQLLLCVIVGLITYVGLLILQVPYALPLAVIAGILEVVPIIGPIISAVPAAIVVLALEPTKTPFVIALYTLVQQLENNLIVPQVMKKSVGISPIITIVAIMVGGTLKGAIGALLAIPVAATIFVVIDHLKQQENKS